MIGKGVVLALVGSFTLAGCAAATIPLSMAATNAMNERNFSAAETIPRMNCAQLREKWSELSNPLALINPLQMAATERSLVRQAAAQRGCQLG